MPCLKPFALQNSIAQAFEPSAVNRAVYAGLRYIAKCFATRPQRRPRIVPPSGASSLIGARKTDKPKMLWNLFFHFKVVRKGRAANLCGSSLCST